MSSLHASMAYDRYLTYEHRVSAAVAGLAPKDEAVMPGALYVAIAGMAGGILVRRRNIAVRGLFPVLVAVAAGEIFIPQTMRNTGRLVRSWEERVPVVQKAHDETEKAVGGGVKSAIEEYRKVKDVVGGWVISGKQAVEEIVKKG